MRPVRAAIAGVVVAGLSAAGGYWFGRQEVAAPEMQGHDHAPAASPAPSHEHHAEPAAQRKILYYRNPMGLPDTSPVPKQDSMGMDYIPVYADEAGEADDGDGDGAVVRISPARVQMLGVRTEPATRMSLMRDVQAVGTVQFSERQQTVVAMRFEGWIEGLYINATGEPVRRGEPLMRVYSPLLLQTQQEYLDAVKLARALPVGEAATASTRLADGAIERLRFLDVPESEIERLRRERTAARAIVWPAPYAGVVVEKMAFEGMRFAPGDPLYRIAAISPIWVIAEVFEQDLARVSVGQAATVTVKSYPGRRFDGRVAFIYPTIGAETRTGRVRVEIPNPSGDLKADMYATVELQSPATTEPALAVPDSAVIDNGVSQVVLIDRGDGRFEPRSVQVGTRAGGFTEILGGVADGDKVVVSANFLIDAESNLKAALGAFTAGGHQH